MNCVDTEVAELCAETLTSSATSVSWWTHNGEDDNVPFDGNGNVTDLVDDNGSVVAHYEYSPFGQTIVATGPMAAANPFRFSTKYCDEETGLLYYGYRYLDTGSGRWLSRDPIEERGELGLYVFRDAVNNIDYLGECLCKVKSLSITDEHSVTWAIRVPASSSQTESYNVYGAVHYFEFTLEIEDYSDKSHCIIQNFMTTKWKGRTTMPWPTQDSTDWWDGSAWSGGGYGLAVAPTVFPYLGSAMPELRVAPDKTPDPLWNGGHKAVFYDAPGLNAVFHSQLPLWIEAAFEIRVLEKETGREMAKLQWAASSFFTRQRIYTTFSAGPSISPPFDAGTAPLFAPNPLPSNPSPLGY